MATTRGILAGAFAGALGTVPMTAWMAAFDRWPGGRTRLLPPKEVAYGVANRMQLHGLLRSDARRPFAWCTHVGFGASAGAVYGALSSSASDRPALRGALFGLGVWAFSYAGWIPAAKILPQVQGQPAWRNVELVSAHVIWGAATGWIAEKIGRSCCART